MMYAWHVHHDILVERLSESLERRIAYIEATKPTEEVATRLRLLRPVQDTKRIAPAVKAYNAAVASIHAAECPDCPWDGKTIFPSVGQ